MHRCDILEYCKSKRAAGKMFQGWTDMQLLVYLHEAIETKLFYYSAVEDKINGMFIASIPSDNSIFVEAVVADDARFLGTLMKIYNCAYTGFKLLAQRNGKLVEYNPVRLFKKFSYAITKPARN